RRIGLPGYPFAQERCWIQPAATAGVAASVESSAAPSRAVRESQDEHAPRTETERTLAGLWHSLLGGRPVGRNDRFFDVGGNSLRATQLIARVRAEIGVELPVAALFESPRLDAMAQRIDALLAEGGAQKRAGIEAVEREGAMPLSYAQERLWFVHEHMPDQ